MTGEQSTRRRFLASSLALAGSCVAGCLNQGTAGGGLGSPSVISETPISGRNLAVTLADDHEVSKLNLIGPDGSAFKSTAVQAGATQVEIELFSLRRGWHYTPGKHELVAIRDEEEIASKKIKLEPDLTIVDVSQYLGGEDDPQNRANVVVTVENRGTAPTWVYYLAFDETPRATQDPRDGHPTTSPLQALELPRTKRETVIASGDSQKFLSKWPPFRFTGEQHCRDMTIDFTLTIYTGIGDNKSQRCRATLSGERIQELHKETCSDISIEMLGGSDTDA